MSYYQWSERDILVKLQRYIPLTDLVCFLENTRTTAFNTKPDRDELLSHLLALRQSYAKGLFNETERFPEDFWVNLSTGAVASALDQLQAALQVSDLEKSKLKVHDALFKLKRLAYITDTEKLADVGVYNCDTFEKQFGMEWYDESTQLIFTEMFKKKKKKYFINRYKTYFLNKIVII